MKRSKVENRHEYDIYASILEAAIDGELFSSLVPKTNLRFHELRKYLQILTMRGLIVNKETLHVRGKYRTTTKGKEFLKHYQALGEIMYKTDEDT